MIIAKGKNDPRPKRSPSSSARGRDALPRKGNGPICQSGKKNDREGTKRKGGARQEPGPGGIPFRARKREGQPVPFKKDVSIDRS